MLFGDLAVNKYFTIQAGVTIYYLYKVEYQHGRGNARDDAGNWYLILDEEEINNASR